MDINKFQEKLAEICKLGEENGKAAEAGADKGMLWRYGS